MEREFEDTKGADRTVKNHLNVLIKYYFMLKLMHLTHVTDQNDT